MSYLEDQRQKALHLRKSLFKDTTNGLFLGKEREFVLGISQENLFEPIRNNVLAYFNHNDIAFWKGDKTTPTGHLLSSQIACLNHLFFIRDKKDLATAVLQGIDPNIATACSIDSENSYVEFEVISRTSTLNETGRKRGANATSIDAMFIAEMQDGSRKLILVEWKYVESYLSQSSKAEGESGITRKGRYLPFLQNKNCPIQFNNNLPTFIEGLFTEPYYQLMRQTLLANEMVKAKEYGVSDYLHLHVMPDENKELKEENPTAKIKMGLAKDASWATLLKQPEKYRVISPKQLLKPLEAFSEAGDWLEYLEKRYWVNNAYNLPVDIAQPLTYKELKKLKCAYVDSLANHPFPEPPAQTSDAHYAVQMLKHLKRQSSQPSQIGIYKNITIFEAANRIGTDLVIINGLLVLLKDRPNDTVRISLGNEHAGDDKGDFTIIKPDGTCEEGEAFNVAPSFLSAKLSFTYAKWKDNAKLKYILLNTAPPEGKTILELKKMGVEICPVNWEDLTLP